MGGRVIGIGRCLLTLDWARFDGVDAGNKKDVSTECGAEHFVDFQTEKDVAGKINELTGGGCHVA
jgi:Zn-dependent alcohol dehydrogenase